MRCTAVMMSASSLRRDILFHGINAWRSLLWSFSSLLLFPASRWASVTQRNATAAYKSLTSLDRTTPRSVQHCCGSRRLLSPRRHLTSVTLLPLHRRSFSNYSLTASAIVWPCFRPTGSSTSTTSRYKMLRNLVANLFFVFLENPWVARIDSSWRKKLQGCVNEECCSKD